jgi:purine-nucleoside phosphorylase
MGSWAKNIFGKERVGRTGIVVAGGNPIGLQNSIVRLFDEVIYTRRRILNTYLLKKRKKIYTLSFNVLGAPAAIDLVTVLHEGGCRNIIFVGYAYGGFQNLEVGSVVVPDRSYHFDGVYRSSRIDRRFSLPDKQLFEKTKAALKKNKILFFQGANISVPAVTMQPKHNNADYKRIRPVCLEMELSACLARAKEIGVRAVGVLVISDNKASSLIDSEKKKQRTSVKKKILKLLVANLEKFNLSQLPGSDKFHLDEHMASIIEDEDSSENVYR